jgi:hypothetical protein
MSARDDPRAFQEVHAWSYGYQIPPSKAMLGAANHLLPGSVVRSCGRRKVGLQHALPPTSLS